MEQTADTAKERKQAHAEHQLRQTALREEVATLSAHREELQETLQVATRGHAEAQAGLMRRGTDLTADYEKRLAEVHKVTRLLPSCARMTHAHLHARICVHARTIDWVAN